MPMETDSSKKQGPTAFVGTMVVVFVLTFVGSITGTYEAIGRENILKIMFFVFLAFLSLDEYRLLCWRVRRLHDIGRSGRLAFNLRLPIWVLTLIVLFFFAWMAWEFAFEPSTETAEGIFLAVLIGGGISLPVILFVSTHIYFRRVLKPFNEFLFTAPGDPGPNKYGPPPAS